MFTYRNNAYACRSQSSSWIETSRGGNCYAVEVPRVFVDDKESTKALYQRFIALTEDTGIKRNCQTLHFAFEFGMYIDDETEGITGKKEIDAALRDIKMKWFGKRITR